MYKDDFSKYDLESRYNTYNKYIRYSEKEYESENIDLNGFKKQIKEINDNYIGEKILIMYYLKVLFKVQKNMKTHIINICLLFGTIGDYRFFQRNLSMLII